MAAPTAKQESGSPAAARTPPHPETLTKPDGAQGYRGGDTGTWQETPHDKAKREQAQRA